jgi:hypothetical protein
MASDLFEPPFPSRPRLGARPFAGGPAAGPPAGNQAPASAPAVRPFAARAVTRQPDADLTAAEETPASAATPGAPMHLFAKEPRDSVQPGATIDDTRDATERPAASEQEVADSTGPHTGEFVSALTSTTPLVPEATAWKGSIESARAPAEEDQADVATTAPVPPEAPFLDAMPPLSLTHNHERMAEPPTGLASWQDAPSPEDTVAGATDRADYAAAASEQGLVPDETETVTVEGGESVAPDQAQSQAADSTGSDVREPLTERPLAVGDEMDRIRESLDQELSQFALRPWERPHAPVPFPAFEEAPPNDDDALTQSGAEDSTPRADQIDRPPAVLQTWHDAGYTAPALERSPGPAAAARDAVEGAAAFAAGAEIAVVLEDVARRLRAGEIVVSHGARTRDQAATLAAVLAAMLGDRT